MMVILFPKSLNSFVIFRRYSSDSRSTKKPDGFWDNEKNRRQFFQDLKLKLGFNTFEDWYKLKSEDVLRNGGSSLLSKYGGSSAKALINTYPEHQWKAWKFSQVPRGFWDILENQKDFLDWLGIQLRIKEKSDWYRVSNRQLQLLGPTHLFEKKGGLANVLIAIYPNHPWDMDKLWSNRISEKTLKLTPTMLKDTFDWIGHQLGCKELEDWYQITVHDVTKYGNELLTNFHGSLEKALVSVYSNHDWLPWKFRQISYGFWEKMENRKKFFIWLEKQLGINAMDDYYKVTYQDISKRGGSGLLARYGGSPSIALQDIYEEHKWNTWMFSQVPRGYWDIIDTQKEFFDWLGNRLGFSKMNDWYNIKQELILKNGGSALLAKYHNSPVKALQSIYPSHDWLPWKFHQTPKGFWDEKKNQRKFFDWLGKELGFTKDSDWYGLTHKIIQEYGAGHLLEKKYDGSISTALQSVFPEQTWDQSKFKTKLWYIPHTQISI